MAFESEYFPVKTPRLSSLTPEDRSAYKKILWGLFGVYAVTIAIAGVVVVGNANYQKADVIVTTRTSPSQQGAVQATNVALRPSTDRRR